MAASGTRFVTYTALLLALAVLLPLALHLINPLFARVLLPMHLPALLGGLLVGPGAGLLVGLLSPGLSYLLTGFPPTYSIALMTVELPVYGLVAGVAYRKFGLHLYASLLLAMLFGRAAFALSLMVLKEFIALPYTVAEYVTGGILAAGLPGIVLQLVIIPIIVTAVKRKGARSRY
ncbi:ECF transporter S component [candidate division GN15 bacterium]|nr:ECF transporter S component [candidate division GN15 bacterium]